MTVDDDLRRGREKLEDLRREAGFDPDDSEPTGHDALERYVQLLEAAVVGGQAAMTMLARTLRRAP